jgi:formylglycine-generating enzyme required for sulfatase activity
MDPFEGTRPGEERVQFCWCPPGTFTMGPFDGPPVAGAAAEVTLSGFWMSKYLVTQDLYTFVMADNPSGFRGATLPVESVHKEDADEFCRRYTAVERAAGRLPRGWEYRLPTDAQWEYACRAGTDTAYSWGADPALADAHAWFQPNSGLRTHPVGEKAPNPWGLFDMHGNCIEWCRDAWTDALPGGTDPEVAPAQVPYRPDWAQPYWVCRGGSWQYPQVERLQSRNRERLGRLDKSYIIGFRMALVRTGARSSIAYRNGGMAMTALKTTGIGEDIVNAVKKYHRDFSAGRFEDAIAVMAPGMTVYSPHGVLQEVPRDKRELQEFVQTYKDIHAQGFRTQTTPWYIDGVVEGNVAVTTFLEQGTVTERSGAKPEQVLRRATQVWVSDGGAWRIVHMHVSNLEKSLAALADA